MSCAMRNPVDAVIGLVTAEGFNEAAQQLRAETNAIAEGPLQRNVSDLICDILRQIDAVLYAEPDSQQLRLARVGSAVYERARNGEWGN